MNKKVEAIVIAVVGCFLFLNQGGSVDIASMTHMYNGILEVNK